MLSVAALTTREHVDALARHLHADRVQIFDEVGGQYPSRS
jgi:hypothetical protein